MCLVLGVADSMATVLGFLGPMILGHSCIKIESLGLVLGGSEVGN